LNLDWILRKMKRFVRLIRSRDHCHHPKLLAPMLTPSRTGFGALLLAAIFSMPACASIADPNAQWPEDSKGTHQFGVASGWAFAQADVKLKNGTGPLADPALGGNPNGASTTELEPIFGLGLRYMYFLTNNWAIGGTFEHRIFDPESTRPLNADVDIDSFGTNHLVFDVRYVMDPIGEKKRLRPYLALQLGYVPGVEADGVVDYGDSFAGVGRPGVTEDISLEGDSFITAGALVGASYLLRDGLSFDMSVFFEKALTSTEAPLILNPIPGVPVLGTESRYDGSLQLEGLFLTFGLSWYF
jgi:hypothetical protein